MKYLLIGVGGFVGANARFLLATWASQRWGTAFPYGTLLVNVAGCFTLGLFAALALQLVWDDRWRLLIAVGFLGAFTTFSTFEADTLDLLTQGRRAQAGLALLNVAGSVALGLCAVAIGGVAARLLLTLAALLRGAAGGSGPT